MLIAEKIYTLLCVLFAVLVITGNLIYQKFVYLPIGEFYIFELSIGAIIYPMTFLLTDLIAEFYGKEKAQFCVKAAISMNILIALIVFCMGKLEATHWSKVDNDIFNQVFGFFGIAFLGSILANYIAQQLDIYLYLTIRKLTNGRFLWLRNNLSTACSLLVDTMIVIGFMTIFDALPKEKMTVLIFNSYLFKLCFTLSSTPLFYALVYLIKELLLKESKCGK